MCARVLVSCGGFEVYGGMMPVASLLDVGSASRTACSFSVWCCNNRIRAKGMAVLVVARGDEPSRTADRGADCGGPLGTRPRRSAEQRVCGGVVLSASVVVW
eukprot:3941410-Rhodomonas_salina.2